MYIYLRDHIRHHFDQRQLADDGHGDGDGGIHVSTTDTARDQDGQSDGHAPAPVDGEKVSFSTAAQNNLYG